MKTLHTIYNNFAKRNFSSLRLLLVMFLTLTASTAWGAYGYTGEGTFTKQNSVDGDGYYVFVLTQGALTTTCSSNYITPNATYKGSEESLSNVVCSSVFQVTNYDATDKDYYILTNNETCLYSSGSGKITYSDTYTQTWKTESSKLKSTSGTTVYMGCINSKFRPYTSSSTNATSFVCVYKLQEANVEYSITLSENGKTKTETITSASYQLPTELSVGSCDSKTFVGWTTTENFTSAKTPTSGDYYEKGETISISGDEIFYAVFATTSGGDGEITTTKTETFENQTSYSSESNWRQALTWSASESKIGVEWTTYYGKILASDDYVELRTYSDRVMGYIWTSQKLKGIKSIQFNGWCVNSTDKADMVVSYSTDNETWNELGTHIAGTTSTSQSNIYTLPDYGVDKEYYISIDLQNATCPNSSNKKYRIDNIAFTFVEGSGTTYSDYTTSCSTETSVTLQPNGGTGTAQVLETTDGSLTLPECDFTYEGYRFVGWNTKANGTGTTYQPSAKYTPIENPATLYAKWAKEYTVTYNANGGTTTCTDNNKYIAGEQVTVCTSTPTKNGYNFNGWSYAPNVTITSGTFTMPESNVTITAQLTAIEYTITYNNTKSATNSNPTTYTIENEITFADLTNLPKGYNFTGWDPASIAKGTTGNQTVTAQWTAKTITITWDANGGSVTPTSSPYTYDGATIALPTPTRTGYSFNGWFTAATGGTQITEVGTTNKPTENVTYYAQWTAIEYTITYQDTKGATNSNPSTYTIEDEITFEALTNLPKGYNFTGWNTASIAKGTTGNQTVIAQWTEKALTRYRTDCDACIPLMGFASISGTYHFFPGETISLTVTPPDVDVPYTYQWQKFVGSAWTDIAGATTTTYTKDETTIADAGKYRCVVSSEGYCDKYAEYNVKCLQLYVYYDNKSDVFNAPLKKVDGATATIDVELQNAGYTYYFKITDGCGNWYGFNGDIHSGWCTDVEMNADAYCGLKTTKFGTYVFNVNYSDLTKLTVSVLYPSAYQAADKVIYLDNNVLNWTNGKIYYRIGRSDHNSKTAMTKVPGTANLYKVTTGEYNNFDVWHLANNGCWSGDNSVYKTNTGDGWAATQATAFETLPVTSDVVTVTPTTLRSKGGDENNNNCEFYDYDITEGMKTWNAKIEEPSHGTITVKYTHHDGTAVNNFTSGDRDLAHTCLLTITATPNVGYSLASLTVNDVPFTSGNVHTLTADAVIKATFTINTHTVTWKLNGGNIGGDESDIVQTYQYGVAIESPEKPTYDCYEFAEWAPTYNAEMTMPDEDLVFTAKWNKLSYTITFKNYDGTVLQTSTVECGETPSYTGATPTREQTAMFEYEFADWTPTVAEATGDQTYTATYNQTKRQYTVTWFVDGKQIDSKSVAAGDLATAPEVNPIPCGAVLVGWTDAENGVYVHGNSTLHEGAQPSIVILENKTFYAVFADYED